MAQNRTAQQANVLVVDDDNKARELLAQILQYEGYDVVQAEDGQRAIELTLEVPWRLILLDLNMPVLSGWEFLRWLECRDIKPAVIVLLGK